MRLQTTRVWLPGLLLWIVSPALVAQEKAGDAVKVQARLGRSLRQLAGEIDKRVQGQKAMFLPLPAERETDLLTAVQGLVLQALLAESVLVVPLAEEDRKALGDDKGKLSLKSVLGSSSLEHLRKTREVKFLVVSQARE